ncbi:MAG: TRAM domain-containing protein, partial [Burkholderiaceae bacterium]
IERIRAWRAICPDLTIRSTFIAGFPGESEAEFDYLLDFLREAELDRVGCFPYSPVEGAVANELAGALPAEVREERAARFMQVQAEISARLLAKKVGTRQPILIDEPTEDGVAVGRSKADAPEIDGLVYVEAKQRLRAGDFVEVEITEAREHDLIARLVD